GCRERHRGDHLPAGAARGGRPPHDALRDARSGLRSRLRPERGTQASAHRRAQQRARLRGKQQLRRAPEVRGMTGERVVVAGVGRVSALGAAGEAFWRSLAAGASGLRPLSLFDPRTERRRLAGEIPEFSPAPFIGTKGIRHFDRTTLLLACAAKLALEDADVLGAAGSPVGGGRIGMAGGTAVASLGSIVAFATEALREDRSCVNPMEFPNTVLNAPASRVSILLGVTGPNATISTGEASALDAVGYAADFLRLRRAEAMMAGGAFGLGEDVYRAFAGTGALSGSRGEQQICAPFDRRRNGVVLGEGSCLLFLQPPPHPRA